MDISWIFKKFAAVPVERPQRSHLFIPLFFQFSPLVLPFVSIISSLTSLFPSLLSRLETTRVKSKCKNFFLSKFKNTPIIFILAGDWYYFFFFLLLLLPFLERRRRTRQDGDVTRGWTCIVNEARNNVTRRTQVRPRASSDGLKKLFIFCLARFLSSHWIDV